MAEALTSHFLGGSLTAASAGLQPLGHVARETLVVLAEIGVATAGLRSKGLEEINLADYHWAVNLTTHSCEPFLPPSLSGRIIRHPVTDPYGGPLELYRQTRDDLRRFITGELPRCLASL